MREIDDKTITEAVKKLIFEATHIIDEKVLNAIKAALENEKEKLPCSILNQIIKNDEIARNESIPMCQDTGITVVFVEIGQDIHINGNLNKAINQGISEAYTEYYLRKSVVNDPLIRKNTNDNTPGIIHYEVVPGDKLKITVAPKGAGSENMSALKMLNPTDGVEGIKNFVLETIKNAGGRACPPLVVGIGIGGNFEKCAFLAKKSLLRDISDTNPISYLAELENSLLAEINELNIGPMGLGGVTTALSVKIESYPCHMASLPVAVNIQCHASRHKEVILWPKMKCKN